MKKEYILYGLKKDEPEYMEDIMYTSYNKNDMKRVKMLAKKKGYVKFRLFHFIDDGKLPNFTGGGGCLVQCTAEGRIIDICYI